MTPYCFVTCPKCKRRAKLTLAAIARGATRTCMLKHEPVVMLATTPRRPRRRPTVIPAHVLDGLRTLVAHADAGGPDDLELDADSPDGARAWANVEAAIVFVRNLPD